MSPLSNVLERLFIKNAENIVAAKSNDDYKQNVKRRSVVLGAEEVHMFVTVVFVTVAFVTAI